MNRESLVIKVGGHGLLKPHYVTAVSEVIAELQNHHGCVLVHGGGEAISAWMERLDIQPKFVNGQRVTDEETIEIVEMVLSAQVNKTLVLALLKAGLDAAGLSGVDRGLLRVEPWPGKMGRVGQIVAVRAQVLLELCNQKVVPVVSPISYGPQGKYNVNADHAAGKIAAALNAKRVVFITNIPGVYARGKMIEKITGAAIEALIEQGEITDGMIPKVSAARAALSSGAGSVTITDLDGLMSGQGTTIIAEESKQ